VCINFTIVLPYQDTGTREDRPTNSLHRVILCCSNLLFKQEKSINRGFRSEARPGYGEKQAFDIFNAKQLGEDAEAPGMLCFLRELDNGM
jgi:hypothetical protein